MRMNDSVFLVEKIGCNGVIVGGFKRAIDLPLNLTLDEAARFWKISKATIYLDPKRYGGKKIRGRGRWRFSRDTLLAMAGLKLDA